MKGYMKQILKVDLSSRKTEVLEIDDDLRRKFVGGSGLGTKLLWDLGAYAADPLDEKNALIFMTGPFANTPALTSGRHAVLARSPLTGIYAESDSGGSFGPELKRTGYDGVVITGKAEKPVYLWISEDGAEIRDAAHLWGKDVFTTDEMLRAETSEKSVTSCIGQSGEKMVRMASIINDGRAARAAGRCGLGAVMGSKNLKALVARGSKKTPLHDRAALADNIKTLAKMIRENMAGMTRLGTAGGLAAFEEMGSLPLKNWKGVERWKDDAARITGATMAERMLTGNYGCERCVIRCGREIEIKEGPYAGLQGAGPEYETLASLGSLCSVNDLAAIAMANDLCNRYGLDTISAGAMVAFAMEAFERGIISERDTEGVRLTWGNAEAMVKTIEMICQNRGIGSILALGVREAAKKLGGGAEDFAVHGSGLEFPMHDSRAYMTLPVEYATSARGACHLSGLSHAFERVITLPEIGLDKVPDRLSYENKGVLTALSQDVMGMFDSLKVCKFTLFGGLKIPNLTDWYRYITGEEMEVETFMRTGERIFNLKRLFNLKCGYVPERDDTLPSRMLKEPKAAEGWKTQLPASLPEMMVEYYAYRGWDKKGYPTREKMAALGLSEEAGLL